MYNVHLSYELQPVEFSFLNFGVIILNRKVHLFPWLDFKHISFPSVIVIFFGAVHFGPRLG